MDRPAERDHAEPSGPRPRPWLAWAAAAAAVIVVAAFVAAYVAARYEARLGQMAREHARAKQELARQGSALRDQLALYRGAVELLRDPATRVVELRGPDSSRATGRVIWNERNGGHVFVANLPPAPAGKAYELWAIAGAAPRPAGVVRVDAEGQGGARIEPRGDGPVKVFALTLEPESGVPAPTGPRVLASK